MKVLVVEDYVPIRKAVEATLREFGYAVDCAVDGVEGLLALAKKRMAFVIISALLLSVAVLWPITGIVLRPANAIAERISSLSVSDLSSRIDTTNCPTELQAIPLRLNELLERLEKSFDRERSRRTSHMSCEHR